MLLSHWQITRDSWQEINLSIPTQFSVSRTDYKSLKTSLLKTNSTPLECKEGFVCWITHYHTPDNFWDFLEILDAASLSQSRIQLLYDIGRVQILPCTGGGAREGSGPPRNVSGVWGGEWGTRSGLLDGKRVEHTLNGALRQIRTLLQTVPVITLKSTSWNEVTLQLGG